jgi:hypothetical protein
MTRNVTLRLDAFGQQGLNRLVSQAKSSPDTAMRTAALYYLADRDAGRAGWRAPRFRARADPSPGLAVAFDDATWGALDREARRQGVDPEALAQHALLYFLADFDSGRLAGRLGEMLSHDE